ncbi:GNAT family N-acetyltransferase [Lysobacter capsici]|jgi:putative acetyltransferase|uniref:GNAT family N-acetyltransferase n=1 Tax=Lysobacter capsici TaxID=435897 RepID=UPI000BBAC6BC|nr:GNAT family N-acetyltransferase [Lysobacter capsici]ATE70054.1 GNAT family N-acetyltransferase [Lysobacter capsici]UOF15252.1 GNAT family N-acetyltransferase [Lysobacter capsici]
MHIRSGELDHPQVIALLREHLRGMAELSPPESVHALDLDGLKRPDVSFWSAWDEDDLLGCGALKQLDAEHGEIKSMRTATAHRRRGVAAALLEHLLGEAGRRRYRRLSLETGSMEGFEPARSLYARYGFDYCGPFADYRDDPNSVFMSKAL